MLPERKPPPDLGMLRRENSLRHPRRVSAGIPWPIIEKPYPAAASPSAGASAASPSAAAPSASAGGSGFGGLLLGDRLGPLLVHLGLGGQTGLLGSLGLVGGELVGSFGCDLGRTSAPSTWRRLGLRPPTARTRPWPHRPAGASCRVTPLYARIARQVSVGCAPFMQPIQSPYRS